LRRLERSVAQPPNGVLFYERMAFAKNKTNMLAKAGEFRPEDRVSPDEENRDPYVVEFLGLKHEYSENTVRFNMSHYLSDRSLVIYVMILPPFTWIVCPVMCLAASLARKATASATSSGAPEWPMGIFLFDSSHSVSV
jgi:hypothetical protein